LHNRRMLNVHEFKARDLQRLSFGALAEVAAQMLEHIGRQSQQIDSQTQAIKFRDVKIERITHELARLKAWRFAAKTERMNAEQKQLFEETLAADQASLEAQLEALQGPARAQRESAAVEPRRQPKRQALPEHLPRIEHLHEPESTTCDCGRPMVRVGEDVSEKLDIVPAQFFVHRHVRGKWACKCCQALVQEPVEPHIIDKGMPAEGLLAHVLVNRFIDHLPYYRQEQINARSGVHTPRSTLAAWSGRAGAGLMPLYEAHRTFVLGAAVLHADETPVNMLDPGSGKTKRAYVWAYARSAFDALPGVAYDFCIGRAAKYPIAFLKGWSGTLVCDDYKAYDSVFKLETRIEAGCLAHYPECSFILRQASCHQRSCGRSMAELHISLDCSQGLQEREQVGLGLPCFRICRLDAGLLPESLHGLSLHLQVGRDVTAGRGDAGVAEVVADHRHVGSRLQKRHGAAVPPMSRKT
jgi:transposase